jgi:hypothetical protein
MAICGCWTEQALFKRSELIFLAPIISCDMDQSRQQFLPVRYAELSVMAFWRTYRLVGGCCLFGQQPHWRQSFSV